MLDQTPTVFNQCVRTSTANGLGTEGKVAAVFRKHKLEFTTRRKDTCILSPYGQCFPDALITAPRQTYVECKSNGAAKGTLYQKLWYTADIYSQLKVRTLVVLDTSNVFIKTTVLKRLKDISGANVTWILLEDLDQWVRQELKEASRTALKQTVIR